MIQHFQSINHYLYRNENNHKAGVAHFLEKLSFGITAKFESSDHVASALEPYGGITEALHFRDVAVYSVSCLSDGLDTATDVLSQVTKAASICTWHESHLSIYPLKLYCTANVQHDINSIHHRPYYTPGSRRERSRKRGRV